jgi:hypothetical protein
MREFGVAANQGKDLILEGERLLRADVFYAICQSSSP